MRTFILASLALAATSVPVSAQEVPSDLDAALVSYFQAEPSEARDEIAARIAAMPGVTPEAVGQRLHKLPLWLSVRPGTTSYSMEIGEDEQRTVWVRVPSGYEPGRPWPVMIALHGQGGRAEEMLSFAVGLLADKADEMIVAAPQAVLSGPFDPQNESELNQPVHLLQLLRRRYHVDSNRVFLIGYSKGGHRTAATGVMFADQFAGIVCMAGIMAPLPQREGLYSYFLPNLQHLPVLMVWGEQDDKGPSGKPASNGGIAAVNRRLARVLEERDLPITMVELPGVGHLGVRPPSDAWAALLAKTRACYPTETAHCFRLPEQGRAYWLRLVEFVGEPWMDPQLRIELRPGEDPQEALLRAIRLKLGRLEGRIDGQLVAVHSKRAKELDVLLQERLVDFDRPITIKMNGRRAYEGMVEPRVETLLEVAAEDWDFDRLFPVCVRIAIGRRGHQM
jgi:poly(3-hydroxybutyrate) depolymerase